MAATIAAAQTGDPGAPQVGVTVAGLSTTTASTVVVDVSWDGGATWNAVRGGTVNGALGSTFVRDYVPALNLSSVYRATVSVGSSEVVTTTVTATSQQAWIQDPLSPRTAVPVSGVRTDDSLFLLSGTAATIARQQAADLVQVLGAALPVASLGVRQKPSGVRLHLRAIAATQGALVTALESMLATAGQIVIRGLPSSIPIDPVAHVIAPDVQDSPVVGDLLGQRRDWVMTLTQTRPTSLRVVIPWWTYDQVKALVQSQVGSTATFDQVKAAMSAGKTYTQWVANPGVV